MKRELKNVLDTMLDAVSALEKIELSKKYMFDIDKGIKTVDIEDEELYEGVSLAYKQGLKDKLIEIQEEHQQKAIDFLKEKAYDVRIAKELSSKGKYHIEEFVKEGKINELKEKLQDMQKRVVVKNIRSEYECSDYYERTQYAEAKAQKSLISKIKTGLFGVPVEVFINGPTQKMEVDKQQGISEDKEVESIVDVINALKYIETSKKYKFDIEKGIRTVNIEDQELYDDIKSAYEQGNIGKLEEIQKQYQEEAIEFLSKKVEEMGTVEKELSQDNIRELVENGKVDILESKLNDVKNTEEKPKSERPLISRIKTKVSDIQEKAPKDKTIKGIKREKLKLSIDLTKTGKQIISKMEELQKRYEENMKKGMKYRDTQKNNDEEEGQIYWMH